MVSHERGTPARCFRYFSSAGWPEQVLARRFHDENLEQLSRVGWQTHDESLKQLSRAGWPIRVEGTGVGGSATDDDRNLAVGGTDVPRSQEIAPP